MIFRQHYKFALIITALFCFSSHAATGQDWADLMKAIKDGDIKKVKAIVPSTIKGDEKTRGDRYLFAVAREEDKKKVGITYGFTFGYRSRSTDIEQYLA